MVDIINLTSGTIVRNIYNYKNNPENAQCQRNGLSVRFQVILNLNWPFLLLLLKKTSGDILVPYEATPVSTSPKDTCIILNPGCKRTGCWDEREPE